MVEKEAPTNQASAEMLGAKLTIERDDLQQIIDSLANRGYRVIGPTVRDGAIIYETIERLEDLPIGWTDRQDAARYRIERRADAALFGYAVGPHSWKRFLHPPVERLWQARRQGDDFAVVESEETAGPLAFIGVRACELRAIAIQDRVFLGGQYLDKYYKKRRDRAFVVAVNCGQAGGTCFCVSMDAGPKVEAGFDLALTELIEEGRHLFMIDVGSAAGADVVRDLPQRPATAEEIAAAERIVDRTRGQMGRQLDTDGIKELLQHDNRRHDRSLRCDRRARAPLGFLFHIGFFLHPRRQRAEFGALALPPMDDPQAGPLDRSVRQLRVRRLRPLHHLVSGRDRYYRGSRGDPGQPRNLRQAGGCRGLNTLSSSRRSSPQIAERLER